MVVQVRGREGVLDEMGRFMLNMSIMLFLLRMYRPGSAETVVR